ncbi:unnamed protein product [Microthlaspi erraticum]|uniref:Uncharacterized protein n=1 Tax=Microthlaspi erraticum TaxID=1685480 RepID=A0A6D2J4G7_9BRAS|nr:unnamed protein product [Microthlaspi erraticum]
MFVYFRVLYASGLIGCTITSFKFSSYKVARLDDQRHVWTWIFISTSPELDKPEVMRNINIRGELPSYLGTKSTILKLLDLSFNKLRRAIPSSYEELRDVENIHLTGNMLNGSIPSWMPKERDGDTIDLSYNNFSDITTQKCVDNHMFLHNGKQLLECFLFEELPVCPELSRGLHINRGGDGDEVTINGTIFEADNYVRKPLYYESEWIGIGISVVVFLLMLIGGIMLSKVQESDGTRFKEPGLEHEAFSLRKIKAATNIQYCKQDW